MSSYNSDGYVMIDMKDVNMSHTSQYVAGIYNRVLSVIDTNKLALIINAGSNTPMAAVVHKRMNYYVINTTLYIFTINSNDIVIIEEAGTATVDVDIVPTLMSGTKIADFAIGAVEGSLYAPTFESEINDNVTAPNSTWSSDKIDDELSLKADAADVYTKSQVDTALSLKADAADVYTKSQVDTALSNKADAADVYTKSQVDTALSNKANSADVYTKSEVDTALSVKADKSDILTANYWKTTQLTIVNGVSVGAGVETQPITISVPQYTGYTVLTFTEVRATGYHGAKVTVQAELANANELVYALYNPSNVNATVTVTVRVIYVKTIT